MKHRDWDRVKAVYSGIIGQVENGSLTWHSSALEISLAINETLLLNQDMRSAQALTTSTKCSRGIYQCESSEDEDYSQNAWCLKYNKGSCDQDAPHKTTIKGQLVSCDHFCSKCWHWDEVKRWHPASSQDCPNHA